MIDTITFKIHLFKNPNDIFKPLINLINTIAKGSEIVQVDRVHLLNLKTNKIAELKANLVTGEYNSVYHFDKLELPSYQGGINMRFDKLNGLLQFEFSVPKFYFGNNVIELMPNIKDKDYSYNLDTSKLANFVHKKIKKAIHKAISDISGNTFNLTDLHFQNISIDRIDFTYNQIFPNYDKAIHYLDCIKECKPLEFKNKHPTDYYNGVSFVTDNYGYKIYHKGIEFEKIQYNQIKNEHYKILKNRSPDDVTYFDTNKYLSFKKIDDLQNYANCILRYEFRCSKKNLSYKFFSEMAFKHNELYQYLKKRLNWLFAHEYKPLKESKFNFTKMEICNNIKFDSGNYYIQYYINGKLNIEYINDKKLLLRIKKTKHVYQQILDTLIRKNYLNFTISNQPNFKDLRDLYSIYSKLETKKINFFLAKDTEYLNKLHSWYGSENSIIPQIDNDQYFEKYLIKVILIQYIKLFYKFQISKLTNNQQIIENAKKHNEKLNTTGSSKLNINKVRQYNELLKKFTLKDLKKKKLMSEATYYRVKKTMQILNKSTSDNYSLVDFSSIDKTFEFPFKIQNSLSINKIFKRLY